MWCCAGDGGFVALRYRPSGGGAKPPCAALAEDCRGERSGKRHRSGVRRGSGRRCAECLAGGMCSRARGSLLRRREHIEMASEPGCVIKSGMGLAVARIAGQVVPGVEVARAWSAAPARNRGERARRGSRPAARCGLRPGVPDDGARSDRLVVVVMSLLGAVGGGAKGPACPWLARMANQCSWEESHGGAEISWRR